MISIKLEELLKENIVKQSTTYNCGPAALATVIKAQGIDCTEMEIAKMAGTDESGTSMYGLIQAARKKGREAVGMRLGLDNLQPHNIVFIKINGTAHYSVIRKISRNKVFLADPSLGEIEINKDTFIQIYSGNALVVK